MREKIAITKAKIRVSADLTLEKTKALPKLTWEKFNGKKFVTGVILTAAAVAIDLYIPMAKPISGYLMNVGVGIGLTGLGHKLIKNKAWIKALITKAIRKR